MRWDQQILYWLETCVHYWTGILRYVLEVLDSSFSAAMGPRRAPLRNQNTLRLTRWQGIAGSDLHPARGSWQSLERAVSRMQTRAAAVEHCVLLSYWMCLKLPVRGPAIEKYRLGWSSYWFLQINGAQRPYILSSTRVERSYACTARVHDFFKFLNRCNGSINNLRNRNAMNHQTPVIRQLGWGLLEYRMMQLTRMTFVIVTRLLPYPTIKR